MDIASLGLWVFDAPNYPTKVVFDDYSLRPQLFRYGPQPPDFNQTQFELSPVKDRVDSEYGVALFFSSLFDKIVICKSLCFRLHDLEVGLIIMFSGRRSDRCSDGQETLCPRKSPSEAQPATGIWLSRRW